MLKRAAKESYFAPPQPTTLRLSLGTGGAEKPASKTLPVLLKD